MFGVIGKIFSVVFGGPAKVVGGLFDAGGFLLSAATKGLSDVVVIRLAALGTFLYFCQPQLVELIQSIAGQGDGVLGLSQENWSRILYSLPVVAALFAKSPGGIGIDEWVKHFGSPGSEKSGGSGNH